MGYDAFGLFRGWCTRASNCLEYVAAGEASDAADANPLRCSRCRCLPQEHVAARAEGYDPNSAEQLAERRKYDVRLLPPDERAATFKGRGDAAFRERNFRTAYLEYTRAIEATPDNHLLLGNRCQAYLKVGKVEAALHDAERAVSLAPEWTKGHYRLGMCLQQMEKHVEAVTHFEQACALDSESEECRKALADALAKKEAWETLQEKLAKARKRTTIRQASDMYEEKKLEAKKYAKAAGVIKEINEFGGELEEKFDAEYRASIQPPPGVEFALTYNPSAAAATEESDGDDVVELEENEESDCLMLEANEEGATSAAAMVDSVSLEDNVEDAASDADSSDLEDFVDEEAEAKREREAALLDDSRFVPEAKEGSTALSLPPRNYILVHEDGRLHKTDDFEPMSFGMQRIHKNDEPEPVWVQTRTARWMRKRARAERARATTLARLAC